MKLLLFLLITQIPAFACSCAMPPSLAELKNGSTYILEVKALNAYRDEETNQQSVEVLDVIKGDRVATGEFGTSFLPSFYYQGQNLFLSSGNISSMCGLDVSMEENENAILFLDKEGRLLSLSSCTSFKYVREFRNKKKYSKILEFVRK